MKEIREVLIESVRKNNETGKVGVCISGGIDSSCILEAMIAAGLKPTCYVARFNETGDQVIDAKRVADYFKVPLAPVDVTDFFGNMPTILRHFEKPQWNLWPWYLMRQAKADYISSIYTGEYSDELFAYPDRSQIAGWIGQLEYVAPAWESCARAWGINLRTPFKALAPFLDFKLGLPIDNTYFKPFNKEVLREAYKGILPSFVLDKPSTAPASPFYLMLVTEALKHKELCLPVIKEMIKRKAFSDWLEGRR